MNIACMRKRTDLNTDSFCIDIASTYLDTTAVLIKEASRKEYKQLIFKALLPTYAYKLDHLLLYVTLTSHYTEFSLPDWMSNGHAVPSGNVLTLQDSIYE